MLDAKTAVSLARMPNVDVRFFLKPPYYQVKHRFQVCILRIISSVTITYFSDNYI